MLRADFYGLAMAVRVGVDEDGLRMGASYEFVEISVIESGRKIVIFRIAVEEGSVGLGNGDEFDVVAILDVLKEAGGVTVSQAGHSDLKRFSGSVGGLGLATSRAE